MYKTVFLFLALSFCAIGQTNKNLKEKQPPVKDTLVTEASVADTLEPIERELMTQKKFGVFTRKPRKPDNKMKLCFNLVSPANTYILCITDSLCKYPETTKILFEKTVGDSTYMLVFVDAFTKVNDRPSCDAGKETKLVFIRWNTVKNKLIWKQRSVSSCLRSITNMSKEAVSQWDGASPLVINYHKGGSNFLELKFDPANYLAGLQSSGETASGN